MSFFESLVNSIEETIIAVDRKNKVKYINKTGEELFGFHSGSVVGKHLALIFNNDNTIMPLVKKAMKEVRPISGNKALFKIRDNMRFDFTVSPLIDKGKAEGAVILLRQTHDMPGKVDEQFDSIMYLLSSVAHEIKNPLGGIRGGAQLLKKKAGCNDSRHLDIIIKETERLDNVVKNYLFIGRKPVFNRLNIHELIEEAVNLLEPHLKLRKITLIRAYDPSLPLIRGDEGKLLQVFINIMKNAKEAMPSGGSLTIKTRPAFEYMVEKKKKVKRRYSVVSVQDTGAGIADEDYEKVFMPFFTRKKEGSGLGLAISGKIIRDHNGMIKIKTKQKKGTSVNIYLPFAD
ncbi:nitrogen regulation protein [bacterium BMS3Abin07]|nr:nitrogen regulation protein [bacterium BMS3Abin07]GBE31306.1 nitrogen regulation protein [bacterium BMS3Bbin05]HDO22149.1 PAS domain S-box protein [Nitrospirota bacterium]HDZ88293.1 PAS domain S-box protein [Nitrospirota bacterium]